MFAAFSRLLWPTQARAHRLGWGLAWLGLTLAGGALLVRSDISSRRDAFLVEARTAHRLLSQRAAQHDAMLATLVLLQPSTLGADRPEQRLLSVQPQLLDVLRRDPGQTWPEAALAQAEDRSRRSRHPELATVDALLGHYTLVQAGVPTSFALRVDTSRLPPWDEWPIARDGPVRLVLRHGPQVLILQAGAAPEHQPAGLTAGFQFSKTLATPSQPFELQLQQATGPVQWPWAALLAWAVGSALALAGLAAWRRAGQARRQAEERLRVGQVARLNALGELAAGLAHELNQPLAALSAQAQAARRLLDSDSPGEPPEPEALALARQALGQTVAQARRAADVVARLRRLVAPPQAPEPAQVQDLTAVARSVLALLAPEIASAGVRAEVRSEVRGEGRGEGRGEARIEEPAVRADPVALEQIVHNLVSNALHALQQVPPEERRLWLLISHDAAAGCARLCVADNGPGLAPEDIHRVFLPFFSTRPGGLGLGLSLCESLAQAQGGQLTAAPRSPRGAEFHLSLPLAYPTAAEPPPAHPTP